MNDKVKVKLIKSVSTTCMGCVYNKMTGCQASEEEFDQCLSQSNAEKFPHVENYIYVEDKN